MGGSQKINSSEIGLELNEDFKVIISWDAKEDIIEAIDR